MDAKSCVQKIVFSSLDALVWFVVCIGIHGRGYRCQDAFLPVLAHTAALRFSIIDWIQPDCSAWYSYDYCSHDVYEVLRTHRGGHNYPRSKPWAHGGVKMHISLDVKTMFNERLS